MTTPSMKEIRETIYSLTACAKRTRAGMQACDKAYALVRQLYTEEEKARVLQVFGSPLEDALGAIGSRGVYAILYPSDES